MLALLLGAAALAAGEAACQSDCSLNGVCSSGRCVCDRPCERPLPMHLTPQPLLPLTPSRGARQGPGRAAAACPTL